MLQKEFFRLLKNITHPINAVAITPLTSDQDVSNVLQENDRAPR